MGLPFMLLFILAVGILFSPLAVEAQPTGTSHRIGFLSPTTGSTPPTDFRNRLLELGYVEGQTIHFESRFAEGRPEHFPALAADLVRLNVSVIVTEGSLATKAAKEATATIPIVLVGVAYPVEAGFVASLARPGSNVTGVTDQAGDLGGKLLQLISETVPKRSRIGILEDPANPVSPRARQDTDEAAQRLGLKLVRVEVRRPEDLEPAFASLSRERAEALIVAATPTLISHRARVAELALRNRLPAITILRPSVEAGLLMSYGASLPVLRRRAADYVDRILKGAKPADMPVEQPTKFDLVINMKAAKAIGLTIPPSILIRADHIIE